MTAFAVTMVESTGATDLTPYVSDLSFRSIDPGGFGSASFNLSRKIDARDFEDQADILIFNAENGMQVGGGRLVDPGRGISASGESWEMQVLGEGVAHMQERKEPYILLDDTRSSRGSSSESTNGGLEWSSGGAPDTSIGGTGGTTGWRMDVKTGTDRSPSTSYADIQYRDHRAVPERHHRQYQFSHQEGRNSTNHRIQSQRSIGSGARTTVTDEPWALAVNNVSRVDRHHRSEPADHPIRTRHSARSRPQRTTGSTFPPVDLGRHTGPERDTDHHRWRPRQQRHREHRHRLPRPLHHTVRRPQRPHRHVGGTGRVDLVWPDGITPYDVLRPADDRRPRPHVAGVGEAAER